MLVAIILLVCVTIYCHIKISLHNNLHKTPLMKLKYFIFVNRNIINNNKRTKPMKLNDLHTNLFISHLYQETNESESALANRLMADNWETSEEFKSFQATKEVLNKIALRKPNPSSIAIIMQYNNRTKELEPLV